MLTKVFVSLFLAVCGSDDAVKVKTPHKCSPNELGCQREKQLPSHYACKCKGVERVCTPEQVKNPKLECYLIY